MVVFKYMLQISKNSLFYLVDYVPNVDLYYYFLGYSKIEDWSSTCQNLEDWFLEELKLWILDNSSIETITYMENSYTIKHAMKDKYS